MKVKQPTVADMSQPVPADLTSARAERVRATAELLRALLAEREPYLRRWIPFQRRISVPGMLSQAAIAQVIAHYLWDSGERSEAEDRLPRNLKDRVHRALQGEV